MNRIIHVIKYSGFIISIIATLAVGQAHAASSHPNFFGYYANLDIPENYDHTNITHLWAGFSSRSDSQSFIMSQLALAKSKGVKSWVDVSWFVFNRSNTSRGCPFTHLSGGATIWDDFVNDLVVNGYIDPFNPSNSTIAAFYPVDEPELCGLKDSNGSPDPDLVSAINLIRDHPLTAGIPIAAIMSPDFRNVKHGLKLFDLVGMDDYSRSTSGYIAYFDTFQGHMTSSQKSFLVPQASRGGMMARYEGYHNPYQIVDKYLADSRIIGIMPFLWKHNQTLGVGDITDLKVAYKDIGNHIANQKPLIRVSDGCFADLEAPAYTIFICDATTTGGTPPYSYEWFGDPSFTNSETALYQFWECIGGGSVAISVRATDANGDTGTSYQKHWCGF